MYDSARPFHETCNLKIRQDIERLATEYGKLKERAFVAGLRIRVSGNARTSLVSVSSLLSLCHSSAFLDFLLMMVSPWVVVNSIIPLFLSILPGDKPRARRLPCQGTQSHPVSDGPL
jgi:hypothetical protein